MNFRHHGCGCSSRRRNISAMGNGSLACNRGPIIAVDVNCLPPSNGNGPTPPAVAGSIIPFASGGPMILTSLLGGALASLGGLVGFGSNFVTASALGLTIDLGAAGLENFAFAVPRAGNVTAISAYFTAAAGISILGPTTVTAEVYRAQAGSNTFSPTGVAVDLALPTGLVVGNPPVFDSASDFNVPVAAGERLLMVYSVNTTGLNVLTVVAGTASAGITIE
ncbi:exosporium glycoprotein BclB-related protein [Sporosarcina sp. HYO08]|uniref:exosporium glycoprotein BclB-related protein n=1 Tax=Sporosarcina sp. HYO08 TaxID=1759557 RepID=UPI00155F2EEE|nr:exosporium glycoprotein BclB-related protein [Sporosarcina sp. HYO08]